MPADAIQRDVITVLTQDHRDLEEMLLRVVGLSAREGWHRRYVIGKIINDLTRHSITEERHLYPAVRAHVPHGHQVADDMLAGHAETERIIERLDELDPVDMVFDRWFSHLVGAVSVHFAAEEATVFPRLADVCDAGTLRELGIRSELTKRTLPSLPGWAPFV
jgi:hemerythrin superfamily protein